MTAQRSYRLVAVALVLAGLCGPVVANMARTGGMMVCLIDDPCIHLAVTETVLRDRFEG